MYKYREQLKNHYNIGQFWVEIDLQDAINYDDDMADKLVKHPTDYLPLFEDVAKEVADEVDQTPAERRARTGHSGHDLVQRERHSTAFHEIGVHFEAGESAGHCDRSVQHAGEGDDYFSAVSRLPGHRPQPQHQHWSGRLSVAAQMLHRPDRTDGQNAHWTRS